MAGRLQLAYTSIVLTKYVQLAIIYRRGTWISKALVWLGNSKRNLMEFPEEARREVGYALHFAQEGEMHLSCKPLKGFGPGVFEIVQDFNKDTYRVVYAVKLKDKVYVLHLFQKKSKQGIKTPPKDLALIKERLRRAKELANE